MQGAAGGTNGGTSAAFNPTTNTIIFGYTQQTVAYNYAFSQALQAAGIAIGGYDYSWKINNADLNTGSLEGKFVLRALNGTALQTYTYQYNEKTRGDSENFQLFSGTQWFPKNHISNNISGFSLEWTGVDDKVWAGYWGPRVRSPSLSLRYVVDLCTTNPLSSPDCPGYLEAYKTQQCTANPLHDPSCSGYAEAYKTQQCTANPLYDPTCPGYATAYYNDQCIKDSLYDKGCEGYATAYAIKYLVNLDPAVTTAVNQQLTANVEIAKADPAKVAVVNSTVDSVLTTPTTTSPTSVTSVVSVLAPPPPPTATPQALQPPPPPPAKQEERAQEQRKSDVEVAKAERKSPNNPQAARKELAAKAAELAQNTAKAATLEAQAAQQGALVNLMGYVPGFAAYQQAVLPDSMTSQIAKSYYKPVIDNTRLQRSLFGGSDSVHKQLVDSQYLNKQ